MQRAQDWRSSGASCLHALNKLLPLYEASCRAATSAPYRGGRGPSSTNVAAETWWNSQFLLPGVTEPLSKDQQLAVTHALAAWTATVEGLPADASGTTADHLRGAWASLLASGKLQGGIGKAEAAARAWRWRELLQRAMDGCHSTSDQRCAASRAAVSS